jgi:hypothetical protein
MAAFIAIPIQVSCCIMRACSGWRTRDVNWISGGFKAETVGQKVESVE